MSHDTRMSQAKQPDMFEDVEEFHAKYGIAYYGPPNEMSLLLQRTRIGHMLEELNEYTSSVMMDDLEGALDALVDLIYVALGTAHLHGFDFNEAWKRVHHANMQKVRAACPEDSKRGVDFDVVKPKGWEAPDLADLVDPSAWNRKEYPGS